MPLLHLWEIQVRACVFAQIDAYAFRAKTNLIYTVVSVYALTGLCYQTVSSCKKWVFKNGGWLTIRLLHLKSHENHLRSGKRHTGQELCPQVVYFTQVCRSGMGSLEDKEREGMGRSVAKAKQSEGLKRVWRGKSLCKEISPERKGGWWERASGKKKKLKPQVI